MKLPGYRPLLAALMLAALVAGCDSGPSQGDRPWRMVASGTQGAVVVDGQTIRGYLRDSLDPAWETEGVLNGAACAEACTTAFLTFEDRPGLFYAADGGSISRRTLPPLDGQLRVLLASRGSVVLLQTTAQHARLLSWRDGKVLQLRELGDGSPLWQGDSSRGTLFVLGESTAMGVALSVDAGGQIGQRVLKRIPHGVMCYDSSKMGTAALPERVFRALRRRLTHVSTCLAGPNLGWVGVSTYLTTSPDNPQGSPSTAVAFADSSGGLSWSRTFHGESFALDPDQGSDLLVTNGQGVEVLETLTGRPVAQFEGIADASYVAARELATISLSGEARWLSY